MSSAAQSSLRTLRESPPETEQLATVVSERWLVGTDAGGAATYLCHGYRDDPAVTTDAKLAELFGSRHSAEAAITRYLDRHGACAHGLTGWRVLPATTWTTFAPASQGQNG